MRFASQKEINGEDNKNKFSCFNPNNRLRHKFSDLNYAKFLSLHTNDQPNIIKEKSPKNTSNNFSFKQNDKTLLKSKTLYIKKNNNNDYINNANISNTFNSKSKSQSMAADHFNGGEESESAYHSEIYNNQLIYFFINDNKSNRKFKIKNNKISTTKYNFITFFPKSLLLQFTRLANIFFLFTAIIQSIPVISPLTSLTAIIPLIFVLGVSMIRELIEDWSKKTYDDINNKEEVIVFRDGSFKKETSESLRVGEIVVSPDVKTIPAEWRLIDSWLSDGISYVGTSA